MTGFEHRRVIQSSDLGPARLALLAKKKERFYVSFQAFRQDLGAVRQLLSQRTLLRSHLKQGEKIRQHRHPDDEGKDQPKTHPHKFAGPFARTRRFENR